MGANYLPSRCWIVGDMEEILWQSGRVACNGSLTLGVFSKPQHFLTPSVEQRFGSSRESVAEPRRPQRPGRRAPAEDYSRSRFLYWLRFNADSLQRPIPAIEVELVLFPTAPNYFDCLVHPAWPLLNRDAIRFELSSPVACAKDEFHPTAADDVQNRRLLCDLNGMLKWQHDQIERNPNPLRPRRYGRCHSSRGWQVAIVSEVVFVEMNPSESVLVRPGNLIQKLLI